jgi:nicotinamide mononucleotide adenylyltransferase
LGKFFFVALLQFGHAKTIIAAMKKKADRVFIIIGFIENFWYESRQILICQKYLEQWHTTTGG